MLSLEWAASAPEDNRRRGFEEPRTSLEHSQTLDYGTIQLAYRSFPGFNGKSYPGLGVQGGAGGEAITQPSRGILSGWEAGVPRG